MKHYKVNNIKSLLLMMIFMISSCGDIAPNVVPPDEVENGTSEESGYYYPEVTGEFPADGSLNVAVDTQYIAVFNIPVDASTLSPNITINSLTNGDLTEVTHYDISPSSGPTTVARITFHYGGANPLLPSDTVTITLTAGIVDNAEGVALNNPGNRSFQTGAAPDITSPVISAQDPADLAGGISLTSPGIYVEFTEAGEIDPTTINSYTFYIEDAGLRIPATYAYTTANNRATLTPAVILTENTAYDVFVTTGIRDLSGNALSAGAAWQFTTTAAPYDPVSGAPVITGPVTDSVTGTTALIEWHASEPTVYQAHYGRGDDTATDLPSGAFTTVFYTFHSLTLSPLTAGKRYWLNIDYEDLSGVAGIISATVQFNTVTPEVPVQVANISGSNPGNQHTVYHAEQKALAANSGALMFWTDAGSGSNHLYGQLFTSGLAKQWNGGAPDAVFTEAGQSYTFLSAIEDETGGAIVLASRGGTGVYAKRLAAAGTLFNWGTNADQAADTGLSIDAAGSGASAVPVYTGMIQRIRSAVYQTEMSSMGLGTPAGTYFFDHDINLSGLTDGDIIMDETNHDGTTIDNNGTVQDFRHILGQDAGIIGPGDTYFIGDTAPDAASFTATNHNMQVAGARNNGASFVYTQNGFTFPAAWLNAGDIIRDGTKYGRITGIATYSTSSIITGSANGYLANNLADSSKTFNAAGPAPYPVVAGDLVRNTDSGAYAVVQSVLANRLTLTTDGIFPSSDIFPLGTENYAIYREWDRADAANPIGTYYQITVNWAMGAAGSDTVNLYNYLGITGTADTRPANPLYDDNADFTAATAVANNDIVINTTNFSAPSNPNMAIVNTASYTIHPRALDMTAGIFSDNQAYQIIRFPAGNTDASDIIDTGTATGGAGLLTSATHAPLWGTGAGLVKIGDIAYNLTDDNYAMITAVTDSSLTLSKDASFTAGDYYLIIRQRGVLYVWQDGANINAKILSMGKTNTVAPFDPVQLIAEFTIATGSNPQAIPDGNGNAIVVYVNGGNIWAVRISGIGTIAWTTNVITNPPAAGESIIDVQPDGAGGAVILFKDNSNLFVQRISNAGATPWAADGRVIENDATVTSQEAFVYDSVNDAVIVAFNNTSDDIRARRVGAASSAVLTITDLAASVQRNPKIYLDTSANEAVIAWEDNRFLSSAGYGIFGMKLINTNSSALIGKSAAWNANTSGTPDQNGAAVILNNYNEYWPNFRIVNYNNGNDALLVWEDWRNATGTPYQGGDLVYTDLDAFAP